MRVVFTQPADMLRNHARERAPEPVRRPSPIIGHLEAARLLDRREFVYRGRAYHVAPVPWPLAAELLDVQQQLRALTDSSPLDDALKIFKRAARLSKRACRPMGLFRRLLWPITRNPFRDATPWQVGRNLGFFSMCLMLDGDLPGAASLAHGTSSPTSPHLSPASQPGQARTATRSPGRTS